MGYFGYFVPVSGVDVENRLLSREVLAEYV
jgi:hypothetical protein